jgi:ribonuclease III
VFKEAFTHRSYLNENPSWDVGHNERLEFLGDAVLELITTHELFVRFPDFEEGKLTGIRAALVNYQTLSQVSQELGLDRFLLTSKGEKNDNGRARDSLLANVFEALLGAIYLDAGYQVAHGFVVAHVLSHTQEVIEEKRDKDVKSLFQELSQEQFKATPTYALIREEGPDHNKTFVVAVHIGKKEIAQGEGFSKQEAEQQAAKNGMYVFEQNRD